MRISESEVCSVLIVTRKAWTVARCVSQVAWVVSGGLAGGVGGGDIVVVWWCWG